MTCSYCNEQGHNIRSCDNAEIVGLWNYILNMDFLRGYGTDYNEEHFSQQSMHLSCVSPYRDVQAMAIRFCNGRLSDNEHVIFEKIYLRIKQIYTESEREDEELAGSIEILNDSSILLSEQSTELNDSSIDINETTIEFNTNCWTIEPLLICLETEEELKAQIYCAICLETHKKIEIVTTNCQHDFCKKCICQHIDYMGQHNIPNCPMCRTIIKTIEIKDADYYEELHDLYVTMPKMKRQRVALPDPDDITDIEFLEEMREIDDYFNWFPQRR